MYNNVNGFIIAIVKVYCSLQRQSICSNGKPDCRNTFMQTLKQRARNYSTYFMRLLVFPANSQIAVIKSILCLRSMEHYEIIANRIIDVLNFKRCFVYIMHDLIFQTYPERCVCSFRNTKCSWTFL